MQYSGKLNIDPTKYLHAIYMIYVREPHMAFTSHQVASALSRASNDTEVVDDVILWTVLLELCRQNILSKISIKRAGDYPWDKLTDNQRAGYHWNFQITEKGRQIISQMERK